MADALLHPSAGTAGIIALMGYLVVFFGLILLLIVVLIVGKVMVSAQKKQAQPAAAAAAEAPAPVELPEARGTAGELKLHDVSERDAALIMAITAYRLGKPINELRFRSIKEVKDE